MQRFDTLVASSHQLHEHVTDVIKNSVPDGSLAKRRTNVAFRMANKEVRERIENHPVAMQRLLKVVNARHKRFKHTGFVVGPFGDHSNPDQPRVYTVSFSGRQRAVTGPAVVLKPSEEHLYAAELEPVQPPVN